LKIVNKKEAESKFHHLPRGTSARVLLLIEEEKVNALLVFTFPSFAKGADRQ
jgi:hypothetical protein